MFFILHRSNRRVLPLVYIPIRYNTNIYKDKQKLCNMCKKPNIVYTGQRISSMPANDNKNILPIHGFATADSYDLDAIYIALFQNHIFTPSWVQKTHDICKNFDDAIYADFVRNVDGNEKFMYLFRNGALVCWNMNSTECLDILGAIKQYEISSYAVDSVWREQESLTYSYVKQRIKLNINRRHISLGNIEQATRNCLYLYSLSETIALSAKLKILQGNLKKYIPLMKATIDTLRTGKKIKISESEVLKKIGELLSLKNSINSSTNILNIYDDRWNKTEHTQIFALNSKYFSLFQRKKLLNTKIHHCMKLMLFLQSHLTNEQHVYLELVIIFLIFLEIVIEIGKNKDSLTEYFHKHFASEKKPKKKFENM